MASFLDLVNSLRQEVGTRSADLTTLVGLAGKDLLLKNWVNRAWMDVQRKHKNWQWMRSSFSFATVANQQAYTAVQAGAVNYGCWMPETFRIRVTNIGYGTEIWLGEWDWTDFRNLYIFGAQRTVVGQPVVFSIAPDKSINLGPVPNATGFTVIGDYFTKAMPLVVDTDVPGLPDQFVDIIMHRAKVYYGQEAGASEVYDAGTADYKRMLANLQGDQLPAVDFGGPLS